MGSRCIDPQSSRSSQSSQRVPGRLRVFFATACFVSFAPCVSFVSAQPPDRAGTEAMARRATERLQALQREADHLASEERTLLNEVRKLEIERQIRTEELQKLAAVRADTERAQIAVKHAEEARNDLIRDIDRRRDLNAQLAGELQTAQQKLQASLRDLANGAPSVEIAPLPLKPFRGELDWPVAGVVRRRFVGNAFRGVEIGALEGADVRAVHDGVVAFADSFAGFGNLVILDHGSQNFSLYGDLLDISVKKGAHVKHGQALGTVGSSVTGPAGLYFELRVDGQTVDPLQWLRKR